MEYIENCISVILNYKNFSDDITPPEKIKLDNTKNKINEFTKGDRYKWSKLVKKNNLYELVPKLCEPKKINRAYFKMTEIIHEFDLFDNYDGSYDNTKFMSAHLAEGPGGFIDSIYDICKEKGINHDWIGITLNDRKDIDKSVQFDSSLDSDNITYGKDNTGNIINIDNLLHLRDFVYSKSKGAYITTADGGFDVSNDYNNQEIKSLELFAHEIIGALMITREKGHFVMKIFDSFNKKTIYLLYILNLCFEEFHIYKPKMSRPCNSERYIVCKNFKGIQNVPFNKVNNTSLELENIIDDDLIKFIKMMHRQNLYYSNVQCNNINNVLSGKQLTKEEQIIKSNEYLNDYIY